MIKNMGLKINSISRICCNFAPSNLKTYLNETLLVINIIVGLCWHVYVGTDIF